MLQADRPVSQANAQKIKNYQRSVRGSYYTSPSYDVFVVLTFA